MQIEKEHFLDASEPDAEGNYDYYYEGNLYHVTVEGQSYKCRSYSDEPERISFLSVNNKVFDTIPYDSAPFAACANHLHHTLGFRHLFVLVREGGGGYQPIDFGKLE